jgi:hypothetical protein
MLGDNPCARVMACKAAAMVVTPPPADWDGITDFVIK